FALRAFPPLWLPAPYRTPWSRPWAARAGRMYCLSNSPAGPAGHQACAAPCMLWTGPRLYWPEPRLDPRRRPTTRSKRLPKPALDDSSEISLPILAHSLALCGWIANPLPLGEGDRRRRSGEGRKSHQILRPSPCPLPEGEGLANPEQLHQIAAQDGFFFGILQKRRLQNEVNGRKPLVRSVGAVNDLGSAKFRDEMP